MNETQCYSKCYHKPPDLSSELTIAIFALDETGPVVIGQDPTENLIFTPSRQELKTFAVYSTISAIQGSNYTDSLAILPYGPDPNWKSLVFSILLDAPLPVHQNMRQVVVFTRLNQIDKIHLQELEQRLISDMKQSLASNKLTVHYVSKLKQQIVSMFEEFSF